MCAVLRCSNDVEVGAHIIGMHGNSTWEHWIVPVCHPCNMRRDDYFFIKSGVDLISANTRRMGCYRPLYA
jgi:hypothetical protein